MLQSLFSSPLLFFLSFPTLIIILTIHEFAHAWVADKLGDPTPRSQGRLTLNPLAHLDPMGTLMMLLTRFGWGKPVEYDPFNLKEPVRDAALIALAGPMINLVTAAVAAGILHLTVLPNVLTGLFVLFISMSVSLAVFNLIPVYPLDGSKVILSLLPAETALEYEEMMHRYGMFILLMMILPLVGGVSAVSHLISPVINFLLNILLW